MAATRSRGAADTLLGGLRNSPEMKRLADEARGFLDAHAGRLTDKVGGGLSKLTDVGESGQLPAIGEGAKRLVSGEGPIRSALGAATSGVADKAKGLLGAGNGGKGKGGREPKAVNIEESIDIGVPVSVAYDQWTQFQEFSRFMKGVESVEQANDTETTWRTKVFKSRRTWKAKIQEQVPDRRIVWTSEGNKGSTKGVVTFHALADDLTRVLVALEYFPSGFMEKTGNIWRAAGRRTRLDLKNFRRFVMMENEPTGSWRGEIQDGKVVKGPDEGTSGRTRPRGERGGAKPARRSSSQDRPARRSGAQSRSARKSTGQERPARKSTAQSKPARKPTGKDQPRKSVSQDAPRRASAAAKPARKSTPQAKPARKSTSQARPRKAAAQRSGTAKKSTGRQTRAANKTTGKR